jgi:hypothetical protein
MHGRNVAGPCGQPASLNRTLILGGAQNERHLVTGLRLPPTGTCPAETGPYSSRRG